jgi:hypothetical protein
MVKWIKTEVRKRIVSAIDPLLRAQGFKYKTSEGFIRKIDGGRQQLANSLVDYNPVFRFSFSLCVRLDAVQRIVNQFSGSPLKYHDSAMTTLTQLEYFGMPPAGSPVQYEVKSEQDLESVLPAVNALISTRVLPFFDEYRDLPSLNRGLNPEGMESRLEPIRFSDRREFDGSNQPYRAMNGVTVAYLSNDVRLPRLIEAYRAQICNCQSHDRQKFEALVNSCK